MDEEQCPKPQLEDSCKPACLKFWKQYKDCEKRIEGDETGEAHCTGQYFDYWRCVDKCVAPKLFTCMK